MMCIPQRFITLLAMAVVLNVCGDLFARDTATSQPATQATTRATTRATTQTAAHAASGPALPTPDEAISLLKEGNARFSAGKSTHPNMTLARLKETTEKGQHPFATVLTCSDSRVAVDRVFDQGVGDLFVVQVAGNVCDTNETGSIEYATEHLSTPLLVVLGHTNCGAVTAVATKAELSGSLPSLVDCIRPAIDKAQVKNPKLAGKELVPAAIEENIWQSIDDLFKKSPQARELVAEGKLKVVGALYDIAAGEVSWLGEHPEQARLLAYTSAPVVVVTPEAAMNRLKDGNARFSAGKSTNPNTEAARLKETAEKGQHPFATVLTCSDSRVPTELVFDQGFGDLFVVRVAGNVCDKHEIASIEYGAGHLGTPMIVVLGHAECGAVTAVAMKAELSGNVPALVHGIQPAVDRAQTKNPELTGKALVPAAVRENVFQSMEDLLKNSEEIRELVKAGKVKLVGAQYEIATGKVRFLGEHPEQARLLNSSEGRLVAKTAGEASAKAAAPAANTH